MFDIKHKIRMDTPADRLYHALTTLTTIQGIVGWWVEEVEGGVSGHDKIRLRFEQQLHKKYPDIVLSIAELQPGKRVRWNVWEGPKEWLGTAIQFEMTSYERRKTIIHFAHKYWRSQTDFCVQCSTQWAVFLLSLKDFMERGSEQVFSNRVRAHAQGLPPLALCS